MLSVPQGGFVTTSEVDVLVTERENDVIYQCHGTNEALGQTVVDTITLKVMCKKQRLLYALLSHTSRTLSTFYHKRKLHFERILVKLLAISVYEKF